MEYFSRGFKSVLGGQGEHEDGPSGAETIERLTDRVSSATLLEDRRDAVRAIKSLSKKFRLEVGTGAMEVLCGVLQKDRSDAEICGLALEALVTVMSSDVGDEQTIQSSADLAVGFCEIFLKDEENVTNLLSLLEEYDFRVRWPTVRLLTALLHNRLMQIQQCVLVSPLGVSRLMDLLCDSREVIRNDGLLLLIHLTKGNAAIQKIVAFENAFDRLLEVLAEEGYSDGGIVAEDCLTLMSNLFNASNINFFREGSFIPRLVPFFDFTEYTTSSRPWNEMKVKNVLLMLKLVRCLVSPSNPPQSTLSSQKVIHSCNLLKLLCDILMTIGIPAEILTETVNTVAEIIRGNQVNQGAFSVVNAPYNPPKPAIVVLLMSMISDKQPFTLRCAVLYCFQSYLYKNSNGQSRIISTLLPSSAEANTNNVTAGQLLCGGLFSADSFSNWCAATALSHALVGNKDLKEQLLRVQLATGVGSQPVSLLQQCSNILSNGGSSAQTKVAVLSLLCHWLASCPVAVSHLLNNGAIIPFLFACIEQPSETHEVVIQGLSATLIGVCMVYNNNDVESFTVDSIKRVITTRHDPEHFLAKINDVSKTEEFVAAAKHTQIQDSDIRNILFDHEFTKHFKKLEGKITRALFDDDDIDVETSKDVLEESSRNKELLKEKAEELAKMTERCKELESSSNQAQRELEKKAIELVQIRNQVAIMKDQTPNVDQVEYFKSQINSLLEQLKTREEQILQLQNQLNEMQVVSTATETLNGVVNHATRNAIEEAFDISSPDEVKRLEELVTELEGKNKGLGEQLRKTKTSLTATQASLEALMANRDREMKEAQEREVKLAELETLKSKLIALEQENVSLKVISLEQKVPDETNEMITRLQAELLIKENAFTQQRQDYEDLLVLLEDQDGKIKKFKNRLRELGEVVADEETDDDDDDESTDDDDDDGGPVKGNLENDIGLEKIPVPNGVDIMVLDLESTPCPNAEEIVIPNGQEIPKDEDVRVPDPLGIEVENPEDIIMNGSASGDQDLKDDAIIDLEIYNVAESLKITEISNEVNDT